MKKLFVTILLSVFLLPTFAEATTWYVGKTGASDSNSCTTAQTITTPKATISAGIACLVAAGAVAGRVLYVKAGTYAERISAAQTLPVGTSWTNAPLIAVNPGDLVTLDPSGSSAIIDLYGSTLQYLIVEGFVVDATGINFGVTIGTGNHIRLRNVEVKNAVKSAIVGAGSFHEYLNLHLHNNGTNSLDHGIYVGTNNNLIEGCNIHDNTGYGVHIYDADGLGADNNIIRRNRIYNHNNLVSTTAGIILSSGTGNVAHNNIIYNNAGGIIIALSAIGSKVYNNTVHGITYSGISVTSASTSAQIKNNIFYNTQTHISNAGSGTVISNNLCGGTGSTSNCAINATPGFADPSTADFSLTSNSSPAANVGVDLGVGFPFNGSFPDVGAFETLPFSSVTMTDLTAPAVDNQMVINHINNVWPPLLPLTDCLGFTVKRNGAPNSITTCARTGTNQITLTLANAYVNGDQALFSYAPGNVTDSALIGNSKNQRLNAITDQVAITTELTGGIPPPPPPTASLAQMASRFECYGGPETAPDCSYPVNTPLTLPPNSCTRLRGLLSNGATAQSSSGYSPYASRNGGAYTAIPNGPCTSTGTCFATGTGTMPPELPIGTPTTEQLAGPGAFIAGGVQLSSSETPDVALLANQDTEFLAALCVGAGNSAGTTFDIRWCRAGGAVLDTYTQTPHILIGGGRTQEGSR